MIWIIYEFQPIFDVHTEHRSSYLSLTAFNILSFTSTNSIFSFISITLYLYRPLPPPLLCNLLCYWVSVSEDEWSPVFVV